MLHPLVHDVEVLDEERTHLLCEAYCDHTGLVVEVLYQMSENVD